MYASRLIEVASLETRTAASLSHQMRTGVVSSLPNEANLTTLTMSTRIAAAVEAAKSSAAGVSTAVDACRRDEASKLPPAKLML